MQPPRKRSCRRRETVALDEAEDEKDEESNARKHEPSYVHESAMRPATSAGASASMRELCCVAAQARAAAQQQKQRQSRSRALRAQPAPLAIPASALRNKANAILCPTGPDHAFGCENQHAAAVATSSAPHIIKSTSPSPFASHTPAPAFLGGSLLDSQPLLRPVQSVPLSAPEPAIQSQLLKVFAPERCRQLGSKGILAAIALATDMQSGIERAYFCGKLTSFCQKNVRSQISAWRRIYKGFCLLGASSGKQAP
jgi:hypothetical protein